MVWSENRDWREKIHHGVQQKSAGVDVGKMGNRAPVALFLRACFRGEIVLRGKSVRAGHSPEYLREWNMRPWDFT